MAIGKSDRRHEAPRPTERLADFVRKCDHASFVGELIFHGPITGWEGRVLERGVFRASKGGFLLRSLAVDWVTGQRKQIERETLGVMVRPSWRSFGIK